MKPPSTIIPDQQIIIGIRNKDKATLEYLYSKLLPVVKRYILQNTGDEGKAEDIFQDALLIVFNKIRKDELQLSSSFSTYFVAICKNLWLNHLRKRKNSFLFFTDEIESFNGLEATSCSKIDMEFTNIFFRHFNKLSQRSQMVVSLHFKKVPPSEVALRLGFKNKEYAISKKYKCLKKLISNIKSDPELKNLIFENERVELF